MTQRHGRRIAVVAVIGLLLLGPAVGAQETDGQITSGWWEGPVVEPWITDTSYSLDSTCSAYGRLWVKEVKTSGITRMRLSFHKYGAYSPTWKLLALASTNVIAFPRDSDNEFPDDDHEYYVHARLGWGVMKGDRGEQVVARFVGERPSIWNPDVVEDIFVGTLVCDPTECIGPQGLITCPTNVEGDGVTGGGGHIVNPGEENDDFYEEPPPSSGLTELGM